MHIILPQWNPECPYEWPQYRHRQFSIIFNNYMNAFRSLEECVLLGIGSAQSQTISCSPKLNIWYQLYSTFFCAALQSCCAFQPDDQDPNGKISSVDYTFHKMQLDFLPGDLYDGWHVPCGTLRKSVHGKN